MENKIREMLELQEKFNLETNGIDWKLGKIDNGKKIDWIRCIYMEACELIDSTPWKHWKDIDGKINLDNIQIELVDIWHFLMSKILSDNSIDSCLANILYISNREIYPDTEDINIEDIANTTEYLISNCLNYKSTISFAYNINPILVTSFFKIANVLNMTIDDIYKLYIGKNCLNKFRQDNGYKDGTYIKIWNGKEDNIVMKQIVDKNDFNFNELYSELEKVYKDIN